jgi:hypothetical protein
VVEEQDMGSFAVGLNVGFRDKVRRDLSVTPGLATLPKITSDDKSPLLVHHTTSLHGLAVYSSLRVRYPGLQSVDHSLLRILMCIFASL